MPQKKNRPAEEKKIKSISRRNFMKGVAGGVIAAGLGTHILVPKALAGGKKLRILQWSHFIPSFDKWLHDTYVKEWGEKNDTEVIVDHVSILELLERPAAEVAALGTISISNNKFLGSQSPCRPPELSMKDGERLKKPYGFRITLY